MKEFYEVCAVAEEAKRMDDNTKAVYAVLKNASEPMTASEIAEACGWVYLDYNGKANVNHQRATRCLFWLRSMGLIERFTIDGEPYEYEDTEMAPADGKAEIIYVDGVMYYRARTVTDKLITVKKTAIPKIAKFKVIAE